MRLATAALAAALIAGPASADEQPVLGLELNGAETIEGGCRLTFLAENGLGSDLAALVMETVLFTTEGRVERLTLFDFGALPQGRPRVRQFDVEGLACTDLGQILVNGATECAGEGIAPVACIEALRARTRTDIELAG